MSVQMNRKPGNVFLSPMTQPKPTAPSHPDGARPKWDYDSQDNLDSWREVFNDMHSNAASREAAYREGATNLIAYDDGVGPDARQQHVLDYYSSGEHRSNAVPPDEPMQAGLTKAQDELVIMTTKRKPIIVPVRKLQNDPRYAIMALPEALWKAYLTYRDQCQTLGFSAVKHGPKWVLLWKPIGG